MADPDDAEVRYTVKELLQDIKHDQATGFSRLETSMSRKADKTDITRVEKTLEGHTAELERHASELGELKGWQENAEQTRRKRLTLGKTAWRVIWALLGLAGTGATTYIGIHGI